MRKGREVRVPWSELAALVRWMPSLREHMDELPEDARKVFEFVYLEPRPEGMAVCRGVWACHWLWWTDKQALRMGLMCADCGTDLRAEGSAYRIADAEGRKRMYCGGCCNHGLDALDALAG
ncbi:hypothetical protein [Streptomyces sp. NPDC002619]|uniref:hypothetical protein n=1 Tax=Streptomyces sp. NPDC002619 TaxID=3364655 RepID=UPI0036C09A85